MNRLRTVLQIGLPIAVILGGVLAARGLIALRAEPRSAPRAALLPTVEVMVASAGPVRLAARSQGTVAPRSQGRLVSEVAGRVTSVSESMVNGGFFEAGQALVELDPVDLVVAVEEARGRVAAAELRIAQEEADARVARADWERLGLGEPDDLVLRKPQLAEARAALAAAGAALRKAELDVERATVRAPYPGRVRSERVDVGQYVARGEELATIYATDWVEVRLPLPDEELSRLDLSTVLYHGNGEREPRELPSVELRARFAGREHVWRGHVVRSEGEIDPLTRMLVVVARVEDPYGRDEAQGAVPLAVGLFVDAVIEGRAVEQAVTLPRAALRGRDQVVVLDGEDRLRSRTVEVLDRDGASVVIGSGVEAGERVVLTALENVGEGTRVRVIGPDAAAAQQEQP
jgi:RND family efflux transporter MFP subunit